MAGKKQTSQRIFMKFFEERFIDCYIEKIIYEEVSVICLKSI